MKKIMTIIGAFALSGALAFAQGPMGGPQGGERPDMSEMMDAGKIAEKQAIKLRDDLGLDDKQYKKVYNIYKKQAQKKIDDMQGSMPSGMPSGMSGGMMGGMGGPGGGMGGPGGGMGGPGGGMGGPGGGMGGGRPSGMGSPSGRMPMGEIDFEGPEDQKTIDARHKKMQKILSTDQYSRYIQMETAQQAAREKRAMEREAKADSTPGRR